MYLLLGAAFISTVLGWWEKWPTLFYGSLFISIFIFTIIELMNIMNHNGVFKTSMKAMSPTKCFLIHKVWSSPDSVLWTTGVIRFIAGILASVSIYISWAYKKSFLKGHYWFITFFWCLTSCTWIISLMPNFLCLIQCASNPILRKISNLNITENELILRFRKVISLWFVHDIVIGIFWIYLSLMLFDLSDDNDDSEWRTIFLSMLSWHIIIIILYNIYFKQLWSLDPILKKNPHMVEPMCSDKFANEIWTTIRICCYIGIYIVIILRLQTDNILDMGFESSLHVIILIICITISSFSKTLTFPKNTNITKNDKKSNADLDF